MTCTVPQPLQEQADAAERRKDQALDRIIATLEGIEIDEKKDAFLTAIQLLIDADKVVTAIKKSRRET
jgi:hypothetical protein